MAFFNTKDVTVYLAAAGAGKTTALMDELSRLLAHYRPDEIAFVTFTRKGVAHGIEQAVRANPDIRADELPHFKTLHALCFRELGLDKAAILSRPHIKVFNKLYGFNITLREAFESHTDDDLLLARYDAERSGVGRSIFSYDNYDVPRYKLFKKQYEAFKAREGVVDFYDCLKKYRETGKPVGVKVAFIDEAQDLTKLQWEVCRIAFANCEKIFIAGDDFQSCFCYAGASPRTLIELSKQYKTIKLEKSYRLSSSVYKFARAIANTITDKIDKDFAPSKEVEGFVKEMTSRDLLVRKIKKDLTENGAQPYRWYLLFRNNCFIADIADMLEQFTIPYHTSKGFCISERELARIRRYYNFRSKGFGTPETLKSFCESYNIKDINDDFTESDLIPSERKYVYFDYVEKWGIYTLEEMSRREPFLLLSTTHRVKGGEADYVAVFLDCTKQVDENMLVNLDEELRVFYVACTRARTGLYLVSSRNKYSLDTLVDSIKEQVA